MAAFGQWPQAWPTTTHQCTTGCPTACGFAYWDDRRGYVQTEMFFEGAPTNAVDLDLGPIEVEPRFPAAVRAPAAVPMRAPGVGIGMRWREYQTRR